MSAFITQFWKDVTHPFGISFITFILGCAALTAGIVTFGPVIKIEAEYQLRRGLQDTFHAQSLQDLIWPNLTFTTDRPRYPEFGMRVPKIYLDEPIVFNVDPNDKKQYAVALKSGIAHANGTTVPGESGLGYYFAHSSLPDVRDQYNAVFYLLGKLEKGDQIEIWYHQVKHIYTVTEKKVTSPEDVSFLDKEYAKPTVVLQTCWPPGTTLQRLLIFAEER